MIVFTLLGLSQHGLKLTARLRFKNKFEQQCHMIFFLHVLKAYFNHDW